MDSSPSIIVEPWEKKCTGERVANIVRVVDAVIVKLDLRIVTGVLVL